MSTLQLPPPVIGFTPDPAAPRFPGKHIAMFAHGFGQDLRPEQMQILVDTIAQYEPRLDGVRQLVRSWNSRRAIRYDWRASALRSLRLSKILPSTAHYKTVKQALGYLTPHLSYPGLTLDHILERPNGLAPLSGAVKLSWSFATLTQLVLFQLGPHLRTEEMLNPARVWTKLQDFRRLALLVRSRPPRAESPQADRISRARFTLALYERTLALLTEERLNTWRYRLAVSERIRIGEHDQILDLPGHWIKLADARSIRAEAYHEMLLSLLTRCHLELLRVGPRRLSF